MHSCEYEAAHLEFFDAILVSKIPIYSFISTCFWCTYKVPPWNLFTQLDKTPVS